MGLRRAFAFALLLTFFWIPAPSAQAHAELVTASPPVGAHLNALPSQVAVTFDGNLLTIGGSKTNILTVVDPNGKEIDAKNSRVTGATLTVDLNPVSTTGEFVVSWRVVSGDGHPEQSSYRFSVNGPSAFSSPTPTPAASPAPTTTADGPDFWARYRTRLLLILGLIVAVSIWIGFERVRRKAE
jgi:methionine-rich copper-binding protein CopC